MSDTPVRVLVAEDSPVFAEAISAVIEADPGLSVVGMASDGQQAVRDATALRPDLIIMDIQMPVMNGLDAISAIMAQAPTPILVLTADSKGYSGQLSFEALRRGALDVMRKPDRWPGSASEQAAFQDRIRLLASVAVVRHVAGAPHRASTQRKPLPEAGRRVARLGVVGVVASTGGPRALADIVSGLPAAWPASMLVVQHIAPGFVEGLAAWLDRVCPLSVSVARDSQRLRPGQVLLAPDGVHLTATVAGRVRLESGQAIGGHRPSGSRLLSSLAFAYGRDALGLVLTGMGSDGVSGLVRLRSAGGTAWVQDAATAAVYGMPRAAWEAGAADTQLSLPLIAEGLRQWADGRGRRGAR